MLKKLIVVVLSIALCASCATVSVDDIPSVTPPVVLSDLTFINPGQEHLNEEFKHRLEILQNNCGFKFIITSGYRPRDHPIEIVKKTIGYHVRRLAADIIVINDRQRMILVREALKLGFKGIGPNKTFVHIDDRNTVGVLWVY